MYTYVIGKDRPFIANVWKYYKTLGGISELNYDVIFD